MSIATIMRITYAEQLTTAAIWAGEGHRGPADLAALFQKSTVGSKHYLNFSHF